MPGLLFLGRGKESLWTRLCHYSAPRRYAVVASLRTDPDSVSVRSSQRIQPAGVARGQVRDGSCGCLSTEHACLRQASEQYFTSSQLFAQRLRQVIGRPQVAQGLVSK